MSIRIRQLTKTYSTGITAILDVSLDVESGQVFCLAGPNGAGKTTLIRQVIGLLSPTSGTIEVCGIDVVKAPERLCGLMAYMPQRPYALYHLTVNEAIVFAGRLRKMASRPAQAQADTLIGRLGLSGYRNTLLRNLSGGMLQLTSLGIASMGDPEVLILDEPTAHLDPHLRQTALNLIAGFGRHGKTVVLVTHMLTEAEPVVDKIAIIRKSLLAIGTPAELRSSVGEFWKAKISHRERVHMSWPEGCAITSSAETKTELLFPRQQFAALAGMIEGLLQIGKIDDVALGPPGLDEVYIAFNDRAQMVEHAEE